MKHLFRTIHLNFFTDETEHVGLAPANSIKMGFDAFYHSIGIFHDVFEHWFEGVHKYFQGEAAFNIGGEMAAMGAAWYYYDKMGLRTRKFGDGIPFAEAIRYETQHMVVSMIKGDYSSLFGERLICHVPYQSRIDNEELEYQIKKFAAIVKDTPSFEDGEDSYKASASFRNIANLHRYGYRMASRYVEQCPANYRTLRDFIETWSQFVIKNPAEKMAEVHSGVIVRLYKNNGLL